MYHAYLLVVDVIHHRTTSNSLVFGDNSFAFMSPSCFAVLLDIFLYYHLFHDFTTCRYILIAPARCICLYQYGSIWAIKRKDITMFTAKQRDYARDYVLEMAQTDPRVTGGAIIGSIAAGTEDNWSDIDVTFGIATGNAIKTVIDDWTQVLERKFGILDHFDLLSGSSIYRVFLLPDGLEIDVSVTPERDFGARGPHFHTLFGSTQQLKATSPPDTRHIIGLSWHHILHARSCIERKKLWQAEYWISEVRNHTLTLLCIRLGESAAYGRGVDKLPVAITNPFADTLVRSLDELELRRALAAATLCLITEIEKWDATLCTRLKPLLQEFGTP